MQHKRPFVSLKWKVLVMLLLTLALVHSLALGLLYYEDQQDFAHARQTLQKDRLEALNGTVQASYARLIDVAQILPMLDDGDPSTREAEGISSLVRHISRKADDLIMQGVVDFIQLYRTDNRLAASWGSAAPLRHAIVERVRSTEQPAQDIVCVIDCMRFVAVPLMLPGGDTAVVAVGSLLHDVVLNFRRQNHVDIGLLRANSGVPGFQVLSMTNREANAPLLAELASRGPLPSGEHVYRVSHNGRTFEMVLAPLVHGQSVGADWLIVTDLTDKLATARHRLLVSLALATLGTLLVLLLQGMLLRRPLSYLQHLARDLPRLAGSPPPHGPPGRQLPEPMHHWAFTDELDILSSSATELSERLDSLESSVADRTQRLERRSAALLRERDFVTRLLETADAVILTQDANGRILSLNRYGSRLLGIDLGQDRAYRFDALGLQEDSEDAVHQLERLYRGELDRLQLDTRYQTASGRDIQLSWQHSRLHDEEPGGAQVLSIAIDMTERRNAESRLYWLANHDPLTRLPNRRLFFDALEQQVRSATEHGRQLAVLCCDIDDFKDVNDTLGHHIGDQLLQAVAQRIGGLVDDESHVARIGADEFVLMLERSQVLASATRVAEHLIQIFVEPFRVEGYEIFSSISIGISLFPEHGAGASDLIRNADLAMIDAKTQGRGRYRIYHADQGSFRVERFTLANDLRRATEQGDFHLHYQPKVDAMTDRVCGMEALLRWRHPEFGNVSPTRFIPLAEEMGLIVPIGRWVLREACRQMAEWQRQGLPPVRVGVNLAGPQIAHESLLQQVDEALADTGLAPRLLDLEITESFAIRQPELTIAKLGQLRERGISLSMDDFGTGYSSLSYLKKLPIDTLKIDQSFVRDIGSDRDDESIVRAIIGMCQSLGIGVLAEGVETREQLDFLLQHGCHQIQGYYYSRPLPPEKLFDFVMQQVS